MFDGYDEGPLTKDAAHLKRTARGVGPAVNVTLNMVMKCKEKFLSNKANKQCFILLLGAKLKTGGCTVHHTKADADVLIVHHVVEAATTTNTILVGDDTNLLVLLCYHANIRPHDIFCKIESKKNAKQLEHGT